MIEDILVYILIFGLGCVGVLALAVLFLVGLGMIEARTPGDN